LIKASISAEIKQPTVIAAITQCSTYGWVVFRQNTLTKLKRPLMHRCSIVEPPNGAIRVGEIVHYRTYTRASNHKSRKKRFKRTYVRVVFRQHKPLKI
jgi:hypothetical protein